LSGDGGQPVDGSQLCLACGLCCQGLLHDWARIETQEIAAAQKLGMHTEMHPDGAAFSLPCPCHRDGRCAVYEERPSPCREYRCKLLRGYQAGQVSWNEALHRVQRARQLMASLRGRLGLPETGSVWRQVRTVDLTPADAEAQLDVAALSAHCLRHFWNRPPAVRSVAP
jgi:Fe-S-cluster containining protein